eukprot:6172923-Pleurochrysis_carterae.AAC.2
MRGVLRPSASRAKRGMSLMAVHGCVLPSMPATRSEHGLTLIRSERRGYMCHVQPPSTTKLTPERPGARWRSRLEKQRGRRDASRALALVDGGCETEGSGDGGAASAGLGGAPLRGYLRVARGAGLDARGDAAGAPMPGVVSLRGAIGVLVGEKSVEKSRQVRCNERLRGWRRRRGAQRRRPEGPRLESNRTPEGACSGCRYPGVRSHVSSNSTRWLARDSTVGTGAARGGRETPFGRDRRSAQPPAVCVASGREGVAGGCR